jgi:xanthine dehydrogenase accessory factor
MRDVARTVTQWLDDGERVAVARVAGLEGFGAVPAGEVLAVRSDGTVAGELLRGTVQGPATEAAQRALAGTAVEVSAPVGEADAVAAGLACSGRARLFVHPIGELDRALWSALADGRPAVLATAVGDDQTGHLMVLDGEVTGSLGDPERDAEVTAEAHRLLGRGATARAELAGALLDVWVPAPTMLIAGGGALDAALTAQARLLGWAPRSVTSVGDAVAAVEAFGPSDVLVLLDHDPAMDAVLLAGIRGGRGFLGALGSRHTQAERRQRLHAAGCTDDELYRVHGPVGLDLGARSPAEVAVSVVAEVIAERAGRHAASLRTTAGPISAN